jgi:guanylate kinase
MEAGTARERRIGVINVSGPYGVGKDSLLNVIREALGDRAWRVPTITTRPVSGGFDPSYTSLSPEDFERATAAGEWLVTNQLGGTARYGTDLSAMADAIESGRTAVLSLYAGPEGAGRLREHFGADLLSLGLVATGGSDDSELAELTRRLEARARDDQATIERRRPAQLEKLAYVRDNPVLPTPDGPLKAFDITVVNDDLDRAGAEVRKALTEFGL